MVEEATLEVRFVRSQRLHSKVGEVCTRKTDNSLYKIFSAFGPTMGPIKLLSILVFVKHERAKSSMFPLAYSSGIPLHQPSTRGQMVETSATYVD